MKMKSEKKNRGFADPGWCFKRHITTFEIKANASENIEAYQSRKLITF